MSKVNISIGKKFERILQELFPDLISTIEDKNTPDFFHPKYSFWLEAKTGYKGWGVRIKDYQVKNFKEFEEPLIYAIGFHNFYNAYQRLTQLTERERQVYLDNNLEVSGICFLAGDLVDLIWEKERKINKKESISYCSIKPSIINSLFERRKIIRYGQEINIEEYYGFLYKDYKFEIFKNNGRPYRAILKKKKNNSFIKFLKEKKLK